MSGAGGTVLGDDAIVLPGSARTRDEAITEAGRLLVASGAVEPSYVDAMHERERSVSTHMGNGLAIPHGTLTAKADIRRTAITFAHYPDGVDWDGEPVRFAVGIAGLNNEHLDILSKIAIVFSDEDEVQKLIEAADANELFTLLEEVNAE